MKTLADKPEKTSLADTSFGNRLAETFDGFKISNPKVFLIVTLIANIVVGVLDYLGMYGSEELKPVILSITSIVTIVLSYLGVRTTRYINTTPNDSNTEQ